MKTKPLVAILGVAAALAVAPSAFAQDYCVADASCVSGGGVDEPTVEAALAAADATFASDRVLIGPGEFVAPTTAGYGAKAFPVEIIGAGAGATTLTGPPDSGTVLYLNGATSRVADLGIVVPATLTNSTKYGLNLVGASGDHLSISADPAIASVTIGTSVASGGSVQDSTIDLPQHGPYTLGVSLQHQSSAQRDDITARNGIDFQGSDTHAIRTRVHANSLGAAVVNSATNVDLTDSLIQMTGNAIGVAVSTGNSTDAGIAVRGSTIVGDGTAATSRGVSVGSNTAHAASALIDSSIIRGFGISIGRAALVAGSSSDVTVQYSDFDPAKILNGAGAGAIAQGPGNVNVDPLFPSASDFNLLAGSPVIDAGNPADLGDVADVDGNPRVADGNGDGIAQREMGAFEAPALPALPPAEPGTGGGSGTGSGSDPSAPGAASDASAASAEVAVDRVAPAITNLKISPRRFAVGRIGLSVQRGGRLTFALSESAQVRVTVRKRSAAGKLRTIGTLQRALSAGQESLRIGRRVGNRTLSAGSYLAQIVATDASGNSSRTSSIRFAVVGS